MHLYKLDEFKFYCAILVVIIHVTASLEEHSLSTFSNFYIYIPFLNIAVPFFFAASGLIMGMKYNNAENFKRYMQKYAFKLLALYITFTLYYLCFNFLLIIMDRLILKTPFWKMSKYFFDSLTMKSFLNGSIGAYQLWFLSSLLLASLLILFFTHIKVSPAIIFLFGIIQYICYSTGILTLNNVFNYGGVFKGFLYLSMGFYLGNKQNLPHSNSIFGFIISMVFYWVLRKTGIGEILMMLSIYYLISYCFKKTGKPTNLSKLGQYSLGVYILHVFFLQLIKKILIYCGIENFYEYWIYYPITIILCVIFSIYLYPIINNLFYKHVEKWFFKFL